MNEEWLPIELTGMLGDPETVSGNQHPCSLLQDVELGFRRFRPRLADVYDIQQPSDPDEQIYGVYWIPFPIEYPLINAWLSGGIGERGVFYVPSQSAGYFLLNRNSWLVVRFVGFLDGPATISSGATNINIVAREPTEFYEWMRTGELQIVRKSGALYHSEIVRYDNAYVDLQRRFHARITQRAQRGTNAKSWDTNAGPVRLYTVHRLENKPAPEIVSVENRDALCARLNPSIDPDTQIVWNNDLNSWYDRPVLCGPGLIKQSRNQREYASHVGSEGVVVYEWHRFNPSCSIPNRYMYGPRTAHNDTSAYYLHNAPSTPHPDMTLARRKNFLGNNWDAYTMTGDAYWRSLPIYLVDGTYDVVSSEILVTGGDGIIPHADYKTLAAGKYYLCMRVMLNGETERVRFLYRFLRNPMVNARDRTQYRELDMTGISVIQFDEVRIWGAPLAAKDDIRNVFKFAIHNGLPPPGDRLYGFMPQRRDSSNQPEGRSGWYGGLPSNDTNPTTDEKVRRNHMIPEPQYAEVEWERVFVEEHRRMWGEIATPERPFLEITLQNVRCVIRDLERDKVWGWEFQPLFLGTGRAVGRASSINHVWTRGYGHGNVLTHAAFAIGFTPRPSTSRNHWEFKAWNDTSDTRKVFVFSPSYAGRVRGRVRVYTAIVWSGGAPSAAAQPYTARFSSDYATPVIKVRLTNPQVGDVVVLYVFENKTARAVAQYTVTDASMTEIEIPDNDDTLAYPYVNATAAYPYGPAISYQGRIIVLDNSVWVSSRSDSPQFSVYPLNEQDGFRILVSDPVDRLLMMDGQPVVVGPRQAYRLVLNRSQVGGGEAVPFPISVQSDTPRLTVPGRLEDYDTFVTREGLISERGLVYKLSEDWYRDSALQSVWVVRTPYGAALVRHYGNRIVVTHPALTVEGYQWTTLSRSSGSFPALRDVQWIDGLTLMFASAVDSSGHCAVRLRQATTRVPAGYYRLNAIKTLQGLRPRQVELHGSASATHPVSVRFYTAQNTLVDTVVIEQPYRAYAVKSQARKIDAPIIEFEVAQGAVWEGAAVRVGSGGQP